MMSGHKRTTITISEAEYRRLCEADRQSRLFQEKLPELLEKNRQEVRESLLSETDRSRERQQSFFELLKVFDEDLQQAENRQTRLLMEAQEALLDRLQTARSAVEEEINSLQDGLARQIEDLLEVQHETSRRICEQQQRIDLLEQTGGWMLADEERKAQIALRWLQHAEALCRFIRNNYDVERFIPGELDATAERLHQAYLNLEDGFSDAVLLEGQQLYRHLSHLRLSLELKQTEWLTLRAALLNGYRLLLELAEEQQVVPAIDMDGNPLPESVEVDVWTSGALSRFIQQISQTLRAVEVDHPDLDMETLRRLAQEDLPAREKELFEIVFQARLELLNSQLRVNIADLTVQALQEQGFVPVQTRFQANDMRWGYQVRLVNLEGAEVLVKIDPDPREFGRNELHLVSRDRPLRTEHELWQRAKIIRQSLQAYGLAIGEMAVEYEKEDVRRVSYPALQPATRSLSNKSIQSSRRHDEHRTA